MITIARPASNAVPTSTAWSARMMFLPSPGASTRTVITTIDRAIIIVWLTPRMIVRRAIGTWTLPRSCSLVEPMARRRLDRRRRDAANAEGGDPDRRRDGVDHRRDRRRRRTDEEQQRQRRQVGERRHDLHDVEDGRHEPHEPVVPAGEDAQRQADRERQHDGRQGQAQRVDARLPQAEHAERDEAGGAEQRQPPAADGQADRGRDGDQAGPRQRVQTADEDVDEPVRHPGGSA